MKPRLLVLSASGNVGRPLVEQLRQTGASFRTAGRREGASVPFDFTRRETYREALEGVDRVFLSMPAVPAMVEWTSVLVQAARKSGVSRIVKLSAYGAFTFARWHRESEKILESSGIECVFLRPNGFMQNLIQFQGASIRAGGTFTAAVGDAKVSYIDAEDIAAAAAAVLLADGTLASAYTLTGSVALSNHRISEILSATTGRKIRYVPVSVEQLGTGMKQRGVPDWQIQGLLELSSYYRSGLAAEVFPGVTELTGRQPGSFEQFANRSKASLATLLP